MKTRLYKELAQFVQAWKNCIKSNNAWSSAHEEKIVALVKKHMPSGSGFDCGTKLDLEASTGEKLVFETSFHHMNEHGFYDGWTEHRVVVTPSLAHDFHVVVRGSNRNDIKDYIAESFNAALCVEVE